MLAAHSVTTSIRLWILSCILSAVGHGGVIAADVPPGSPIELNALRVWSGRIPAERAVAGPARAYLSDQKQWEKLYTDWNVGRNPAPIIDFDRHLIIVVTASCSVIQVTPLLTGTDVSIKQQLSADFTSDLGFQLILISKAGISSYDGRPLLRHQQ